jgi:NADPH:quinone reductase-like Zn-dependent oxidoreductase
MRLQGLLTKDVQVRFTLVYAMSTAAHAEAAHDLNQALRAGALKPRIAQRFRLDEIAAVHERMGTGGMGGKAVLEIQRDADKDENRA